MSESENEQCEVCWSCQKQGRKLSEIRLLGSRTIYLGDPDWDQGLPTVTTSWVCPECRTSPVDPGV